MSLLYLVRHGQASFGADDYDSLSAAGRRQCEVLADYFCDRSLRVDTLLCGNLNRQRQTADILAERLLAQRLCTTPVVDPGFDEYDAEPILAGFADSLDAAELARSEWPQHRNERKVFQRFLERAAVAWVESEIEHQYLEPWQQFRARVIRAFALLRSNPQRNQTIVVSTSAGVIATIVASVLELPPRKAMELNWVLYNASVTQILFNNDRVSLSSFNGVAHLDCAEYRHLLTYR